jgi:phosphoglycerate-specific signal transduction histidine kinase
MASNDQINIKVDEVKKIASNINDKKDKMISVYNNTVVPVLTASSQHLKVAGLNYDEIRAAFKDLFDIVNSEIVNLTSTLTDKVIPNYESLQSKNADTFK